MEHGQQVGIHCSVLYMCTHIRPDSQVIEMINLSLGHENQNYIYIMFHSANRTHNEEEGLGATAGLPRTFWGLTQVKLSN